MKFLISAILLTSIFLINGLPAFGNPEDIVFDHITNDQGLSNNSISGIVQDNQGFLWFGTQDGLNRYDGVTFTIYKNDPQNAGSPASNLISTIYKDNKGQIWVGFYEHGVNKFDAKTNSFVQFKQLDILDPEKKMLNANCFYQDRQSKMWIGTKYNLINFDEATGKVKIYTLPATEVFFINSIVEDNEGNLWVRTGSRLYIFDRQTGQFTPILSYGGLYSFTFITLGDLLLHPSGMLYVSTFDGIYVIDTKTKKVVRTYLTDLEKGARNDFPTKLLLTDNNTLWVGLTETGLRRIDLNTGEIEQYQHDVQNPNSLISNNVTALFKDSSGVLWIGDFIYGLSKYSPTANKFKRYRHNPFKQDSLSNNYIRGIYEDRQGYIWIGTQFGGLNRFDPKTFRFAHYQHDPEKADSLPNDNIWATYEDHVQQFWVGSFNGGLFMMDREKGSFTLFTGIPSDTNILTIYESKDGYLWVGALQGLFLISPDRKKSVYYHPTDLDFSYTNNGVQAIYQDHYGDIWIGSDLGLTRFNKAENGYQKEPHNIGHSGNMTSVFVTNIVETRDGTIWVATKGGGLNRFDRDTATFTPFTTTNGLPHNNIYGVCEDKQGNLWLSSDNGIARFDPNSMQVRIFNTDDGLQAKEYNRRAFSQTRDGQIAFGGILGFNIFYPEKISDNKTMPPVWIKDLTILTNNLTLNIVDTNQQEITLTHDQNYLQFSFAALDFNAPERNSYSYKLENFDQQWINVHNKREVTYTNLDAGEYIFRLKAANSDGVWNEMGTSLKLIIMPPLWKRWWAYLIYITALMAFVWHRSMVFKRQTQLLEAKVTERTIQLKQSEQELTTKTVELANTVKQLSVSENVAINAKEDAIKANLAKSSFLANMSHETRTLLNGVVGMISILLHTELTPQQQEYATTAQRSGETLLAIINDILDLSKIESGNLELEHIELVPSRIVEDITEIFAEQAHRKKLELLSYIDPRLNNTFCGDPVRLRQVLMNLVGNAMKFTSKGEIIIKATMQTAASNKEAILRFEVKDSGIGITPEGKARLFQPFSQVDNSTTRIYGGTGLGLNIAKQLVVMMGGEIDVESEVHHGSTFWFTVKLEKSDKESPNPWFSAELRSRTALLFSNNQSLGTLLAKQIASWGIITDYVDNISGMMSKFYEKQRTQKYDFFIFDIHNIALQEFRIIKALKRDILFATTRLIVLAEPFHKELESLRKEIQVNEVVSKPVRQTVLFNALIGVLNPIKVPPTTYKNRPVVKGNREKYNQKQRILIAEDNIVNQTVIKALVERLGYSADIVNNGEEILIAISQISYPVILMDCQMPVMDGYEATRQIRKLLTPENQPKIIAMTANALKEDRDLCIAAGMDDYITKPVNLERLRAILESIFVEQHNKVEPSIIVDSQTPALQIPNLQTPASQTPNAQLPNAQLLDSQTLAIVPIESFDKRSLAEFFQIANATDNSAANNLIDIYLEDTQKKLKLLRDATKKMDMIMVKRIAHSLKSSSGQLGAKKMQSLTAKLELIAPSNNDGEINGLIDELDKEFIVVIKLLRNTNFCEISIS